MSTLTGVQRYACELVSRLDGKVQAIYPTYRLSGLGGHLWDQTVLPILARGHLLWSPANVGPVSMRRQVLTIHDLASIDHPEWFARRFAAWYNYVVPRLAHRVIRVITVSEFSKRRLVELTGVLESRVQVVPNGVDDRFYPRSSNEIGDVKKKTAIFPENYILTVCSLEPRKNLGQLFKAWSLCEGRIPEDIWLVVAGGEGKQHIFRSNNIESVPKRVVFTGYVADDYLPALYSGAVAFAYPSIYEGFGLPVLEAMASGTVPIAANSTALPEVVADAGLLVDPFQPEDLAAAIIRIVEDSDLRNELSRRGIKRSRKFTWERAADRTWRTLTEAAQI